MKHILAAAVILVALTIGIWVVAIPETIITGSIENALNRNDLTVECKGFSKKILFGFAIEKIELKKNGQTLLAVDNVAGHIHILSLFRMRLPVSFSGQVGAGNLTGQLLLLRKTPDVNLTVSGVKAEELPFFSRLGIKGSGTFSGELHMASSKGDIRFDIREAKFISGTFGSLTIPLDMFSAMKGAIDIDGGRLNVKSFSLEGSGIYARVKGNITGNQMNLILELMPEKFFAEKYAMTLLLERYKVSPGYYSIPINSPLGI